MAFLVSLCPSPRYGVVEGRSTLGLRLVARQEMEALGPFPLDSRDAFVVTYTVWQRCMNLIRRLGSLFARG